MKRIIFILLLLSGLIRVQAQNAAEDFRKVSETMSKGKYLSMEIDVWIYEDKNTTKGVLLGNAIMHKQDRNYYSKFLKDEMISEGNKTIIIDHEEKSITYFESAPGPVMQTPGEVNIDSLLQISDSVKFTGNNNGIKEYRIFQNDAEIKRMDVFLDSKSGFITKLVYYYPEPTKDVSYEAHKIVLDYKMVSDKKPQDSFFRLSKYLVIKGKNVSLTDAYKKYKLVITTDIKD